MIKKNENERKEINALIRYINKEKKWFFKKLLPFFFLILNSYFIYIYIYIYIYILILIDFSFLCNKQNCQKQYFFF